MVDNSLPEGTLIYREYEAQLTDDTRTTVIITLGVLSDGSGSAVRARANGASVYGHVVVLGSPSEGPAMEWASNGSEITIVATGQLLRTELRYAIGAFVQHFVRALGQEIDGFSENPPTLH